MKKLLTIALLAFSSVWANAATMVPSSLVNWVAPLPLTNGGTGATTAAAARSALGVPSTGGNTFSGAQVTAYSTPVNYLNDTSGSNAAQVLYQSAGLTTWGVLKTSANNFAIARYVSGSFADNPLSFATATGVGTFTQRPIFGTATPWDSANLASPASTTSPTFTGTPAAPTATAGTSTTQIATTAFVLGQASSTMPAMDGAAAVGTGTTFARADHVHPTDTSRAPLASPTFTGTVTTAALSATTLSASGNDALVYQNASGQSIPNASTTTVTNWTKLFDRVNANFNAATGVFTAPATGYYRVSATCQFVATAGAVSNQMGWVVTANGAVVAQSPYLIEAAGSTPRAVSVDTIVSLSAGQTLTLGLYQNTGAALALSNTAANNWIAINRIP